MKMTLTEVRNKFLGKKFRLKVDVPLHSKWDWGSGAPYAYIPAGLEGTLTRVIEKSMYLDYEFVSDKGFEMKPVGKPYKYFLWRVEIDGVSKKWYTTKEIEPVN